MKTVELQIAEDLLARLDALPEVAEHGRSHVIGRALERFLSQHLQQDVAAGYRAAYGEPGHADRDTEVDSDLLGAWTGD